MITLLLIIFIFYILNNNKEYFIEEKIDIYKNEFLNIIEKFNLEGDLNIKYRVGIISSINKKYLNLNESSVDFNSLMLKELYLKKLNPKNKFYIFNKNKFFLNYNTEKNQGDIKLINLDENNEFEIIDIGDKFYKLDFNKFRFTGNIKIKDKYLGSNGFSNNPEILFFDIIILL